jgi:hypothetical protein
MNNGQFARVVNSFLGMTETIREGVLCEIPRNLGLPLPHFFNYLYLAPTRTSRHHVSNPLGAFPLVLRKVSSKSFPLGTLFPGFNRAAAASGLGSYFPGGNPLPPVDSISPNFSHRFLLCIFTPLSFRMPPAFTSYDAGPGKGGSVDCRLSRLISAAFSCSGVASTLFPICARLRSSPATVIGFGVSSSGSCSPGPGLCAASLLTKLDLFFALGIVDGPTVRKVTGSYSPGAGPAREARKFWSRDGGSFHFTPPSLRKALPAVSYAPGAGAFSVSFFCRTDYTYRRAMVCAGNLVSVNRRVPEVRTS